MATKKAQVTHVKVILERRHYDSTGKRLSPKPFEQFYTPLEWMAFQNAGPGLGFFVTEVLEAPEGVDTLYSMPTPESKAADAWAKAEKVKAQQ